MWLLAIAVAVAGANALDWAGMVDLSRSAYPAPRCPWIAHIVGGFLFNLAGAPGVTGLNLWSLFVAVIGAVVFLVLYHLLFRRSTL